jgi:hypothetical protein
MPPIRNARYVPVLDGIEMNVIHMAFEVGIVSDCMFPKATLPDSFFTFDNLAGGSRFVLKAARKATLYQAPTDRELRVTFRQGPERVDVVRKHTDRDSLERTTLANKSVDLSQTIDLVDEQRAGSIGENDREEEHTPLMFARRYCGMTTYIILGWWARFALPTLI